MGKPKASLMFKGRPLLHRVIDDLRPEVSEVVVVVAADQHLVSPSPDVRIVTDHEPAHGPLMGLYCGLTASRTDLILAVACDMPYVSGPLLSAMAELATGHDAVMPLFNDRPQLLHAVYRKSCVATMERLLAQGTHRLGALAEAVNTRYVSAEEWAPFDPDGRAFLNLNTPEELARAEMLD